MTNQTKNKKLPWAVITGGASGIGEEISKQLNMSYRLAITYFRDEKRVQKLVQSLIKNNPNSYVKYYKMDLEDTSSIDQAYNKMKNDFGSAPTVLINNAGVSSQALVLTETLDNYAKLMKVNYLGPVFLSKIICADMARNKIGRIINITSNAVVKLEKGLSAYACSKSALEIFGLSLGGEMKKFNITVNNIRPGLTNTRMTNEMIKLNDQLDDSKKFLKVPTLTDASSIGKAVAFLIESDQINCATLTVDNGYSATSI